MPFPLAFEIQVQLPSRQGTPRLPALLLPPIAASLRANGAIAIEQAETGVSFRLPWLNTYNFSGFEPLVMVDSGRIWVLAEGVGPPTLRARFSFARSALAALLLPVVGWFIGGSAGSGTFGLVALGGLAFAYAITRVRILGWLEELAKALSIEDAETVAT